MQTGSCKKCDKNRYANLSLCYLHHREHEKAKKEAKAKEEKQRAEAKRLKKLQTVSGRSKLKKKAEALLHMYIRRRAMRPDGLIQCYTCKKLKPLEKVHAGHRYHGKLDLDERNLKPQCGWYCNVSLSGNLGNYERNLVADYGKEWADQLYLDAQRDTGQYTYDFLIQAIEKYTNLLKTL